MDLLPVHEWQLHARGNPTRQNSANPPKMKGRGAFDSFLCRSEEELDGTPESHLDNNYAWFVGSPKLCSYPRIFVVEGFKFSEESKLSYNEGGIDKKQTAGLVCPLRRLDN
ncbi:hypothetical protein EMPG_14920 [Blastomyces silverae]|uniref:Uncharacterized protein n=1 Tax=Blastomyces silverae TaxID=2060906 RepID=A0A0H1BF57_9EURO|nr:hypothetical protein EMPG_14920 [Blastomyces silverae]